MTLLVDQKFRLVQTLAELFGAKYFVPIIRYQKKSTIFPAMWSLKFTGKLKLVANLQNSRFITLVLVRDPAYNSQGTSVPTSADTPPPQSRRGFYIF